MNDVFADTFYYLAILNERDAAHPRSVAATACVHGKLVTTAYVLTELADGLSATHHRKLVSPFVKQLQQDPSVQIVPADHAWFDRGLNLYDNRPDKSWSYFLLDRQFPDLELKLRGFLTHFISFGKPDRSGDLLKLGRDRHLIPARLYAWHRIAAERHCFQRLGTAIQREQCLANVSRLTILLNELFLLVLEMFRGRKVELDETLAGSLRTVDLFWKDLVANPDQLGTELRWLVAAGWARRISSI